MHDQLGQKPLLLLLIAFSALIEWPVSLLQGVYGSNALIDMSLNAKKVFLKRKNLNQGCHVVVPLTSRHTSLVEPQRGNFRIGLIKLAFFQSD